MDPLDRPINVARAELMFRLVQEQSRPAGVSLHRHISILASSTRLSGRAVMHYVHILNHLLPTASGASDG